MSFLIFLLSNGVEEKIAPYLEKCKNKQGLVGYKVVPFMKGYGFTYNKEFVEATKQIYLVLQKETDDLIGAISELFIANNIKTCKGLTMNKVRTKYLIDKLVKPSLDK